MKVKSSFRVNVLYVIVGTALLCSLECLETVY